MSLWIIYESTNPGVWRMVQSKGIYKNYERALKAAVEMQRWHREELKPDNPNYGWRFKPVEYKPVTQA